MGRAQRNPSSPARLHRLCDGFRLRLYPSYGSQIAWPPCEHRRMTDDRIIAADATREDEAIEASIRPKRLDEYLGQQPVREQLSIYIEAAKRRAESLDHVLIFGPPGRSEEHTSELPSLMRHSYAVFCLK